jgi:(S)-sulfolactate dehydrogenase
MPLTEGTRLLLDAPTFADETRCDLINTSRGGIVDEAALAAALRGGMLGGAARRLRAEPLPAANVLAGCPRLLLTPHIAGVTRESNARVSALVAREVGAALLRRGGDSAHA